MSFAVSSATADLVAAIAWPLVALLALVFLWSARGKLLLAPLLRRLRKLGGGGFTIELSAESAGATKTEVEGTLREYAAALDQEFRRLAYAHSVREHLKSVVRAVFDDARLQGWTKPDDYRATVHVKDALFTGTLYQLLDYHPNPRAGRAGRRFSTRFGMLGLAWRLERSVVRVRVPVEAKELIENWGMTDTEAEAAASGRHSFVCIALRGAGEPLIGILYVDAKDEGAFPDDIQARFENAPGLEPLRVAVQKVHDEIARKGPGLANIVDV